MAKAFDAWTVLDHGTIEKLADNLWRVEGTLPGFALRRVMTLVRMSDGRVIVHNAIALKDDEMKEVDAWGKVAFIVVPNGIHRLDAPSWKKRYPDARVITAAGSRKKVEEVVSVDGTYETFEGDDAVRFETLKGVKEAEGAMIVRSTDGTTVVLNDAVFNMDKKPGFIDNMFLTVMGSAPGPRVSRIAKLMLIKDKKALREDLLRFAALPDLTRLIVSHEKVASGPDAAEALRQAATYL
jgi:hypothetical protein